MHESYDKIYLDLNRFSQCVSVCRVNSAHVSFMVDAIQIFDDEKISYRPLNLDPLHFITDEPRSLASGPRASLPTQSTCGEMNFRIVFQYSIGGSLLNHVVKS